MNKGVSIEKEWREALSAFFETKAWDKLNIFIKNEYATKKIYPSPKDIFNAFNITPLRNVKVVILGQDPYHGEGQAHGLSFSVEDGTPLPPSLKNIYKEIEADLGIKKDFTKGDLTQWAEQGVFLLNAVLSVIAQSPASHQKKGWEEFTDLVIKTISDKQEHVVFMLWGNFAKSKKNLINTSKHLVLEAPHPSPFSVHTGFFGSKHFSQCNQYLESNNKTKINW